MRAEFHLANFEPLHVAGDLKWLLDQLGVAYDHTISQKAAISLWVDHTSGIRVWQVSNPNSWVEVLESMLLLHAA